MMVKSSVNRIGQICLVLSLFLLFLTGCRNGNTQIPNSPDDVSADVSDEDTAVSAVSSPSEDDGTVTVLYTSDPPKAGGDKKYTLAPGQAQEHEVTAADRRGYHFLGWNDGVLTASRSGDVITEDTVLTARYAYDFLENVPVIAIYTENMKNVTSKEEYMGASVSVMNCHYRYERTALSCEIRGRGNSSWSAPKQPYTLRFAEKINLLGIGEGAARKWLLLPYYHDQSFFRTYAAFEMADRLGNFRYVPDMQLVEVYVNGAYRGVYHAVEPIQIHEYRLDLPEPLDAGEKEFSFLVEFDGRAVNEGVVNRDYVQVNGLYYGIRSDVFSQRQIFFIKDKLEMLDEVVDQGNRRRVEAILDVESAVDMYLLLEYFMNVDANHTSIYLYWDQTTEKFYYGPPWDYDVSSGGYDGLNKVDADGLYAGKEPLDKSGSSILRKLCGNNTWFVPLAAQRWLTMREYIDPLIRQVEDLSLFYADAIARNFEQWRIFPQNLRRDEEYITPKTYEEHIDLFLFWLDWRRDGLDAYFDRIREEYGS